jgi:hypothetical protein
MEMLPVTFATVGKSGGVATTPDNVIDMIVRGKVHSFWVY